MYRKVVDKKRMRGFQWKQNFHVPGITNAPIIDPKAGAFQHVLPIHVSR